MSKTFHNKIEYLKLSDKINFLCSVVFVVSFGHILSFAFMASFLSISIIRYGYVVHHGKLEGDGGIGLRIVGFTLSLMGPLMAYLWFYSPDGSDHFFVRLPLFLWGILLLFERFFNGSSFQKLMRDVEMEYEASKRNDDV